MKNNKKGLSTVVETLIIILLVLVAVGIIWGVVSGVLNKGKGQVESSTKCIEVEITAKNVVNVSGGYDVTLQRTSGGESTPFYAKVILYSDSSNSALTVFQNATSAIAFMPLDIKTATITTTLANANKIDVTPYYLDDKGEEKICATTSSYTFTA